MKTQLQENTAATQQLQSALDQRTAEYELLLQLSKSIAQARNRDDLRNAMTDQLLGLFNASYYTLCLINEDGGTHSPFLHSEEKKIVTRTGESPIIHQKHPIEDGIFDVVLQAHYPIILPLASLIRRTGIPQYIYHWYNAGIKEMMLVKISSGNEPKGVLYLYTKQEEGFNETQFNLASGVSDILSTGIANILTNEKLETQIEEIKKYKQELELENRYLRDEQIKNNLSGIIVGNSREMQHVYEMISRVAATDTTVLITGETGTGKELIARAIHEASPRKSKLMIKVNCAAMPASLMESELFGHEKGSFTGALDRRIGKFELAANSTLFLDEIGELPLELQAKLLRALQEKEIERVGGNGSIKVNVRIVTATNRNLEKEVAEGRFRSDLYYRLNVFPIPLPALRSRTADIPLLANHFAEKYCRCTGKKPQHISRKAMEQLCFYNWPGNIREMEHLIERTVLLTDGGDIPEFEMPGTIKTAQPTEEGLVDIRPLVEIEREYILKVLKQHQGRVSGPNGAAVKLGLPPTTLISRMQKLGIKKEHWG